MLNSRNYGRVLGEGTKIADNHAYLRSLNKRQNASDRKPKRSDLLAKSLNTFKSFQLSNKQSEE